MDSQKSCLAKCLLLLDHISPYGSVLFYPPQRTQRSQRKDVTSRYRGLYPVPLRVLCALCGKTFLHSTVKFSDSLCQRQPDHKQRPAAGHIRRSDAPPEAFDHSFHLPEADAAAPGLAGLERLKQDLRQQLYQDARTVLSITSTTTWSDSLSLQALILTEVSSPPASKTLRRRQGSDLNY